ncbi:hypothetical protein [Geomobilimonas luticola]|uniref:DUF2993 domain-containing protein n=1 Tax=Geomobilimonas luticola TaxID=1114878 RepID=A0ABS5S9W4_9BACT|nr:hypothetical protein [Geomobilimonas luticola]
MGIFDRLNNTLKNPAFKELLKDQRLKEVVTRREFRVTEEYFQREFLDLAMDEELRGLSLRFFDGYGEIAGEVKKRLLPFAIPFTARFTVQKVAFTTWEKQVYLQVEQIKPLDLEWVTARLVGKIPFLSCRDGVIACDLARVPRLAEFFSYSLKGMRLADMLTVKELSLREGELVGRLGVCL